MIFRKYLNKDTTQIINLLNNCFPARNISAQSFVWKHFDKFFNGQTESYVAEENDNIRAFVCFVPIYIGYQENILNYYSCAVQATHPEYRRQGLITTLTQMVEKKMDKQSNYIGFSNYEGVKIDKHSKKINYDIIGQMSTRHVLSFPYKTDIKFIKIQKLDLETKNHPYYSIHKNKDYFVWRYEKNPKCKYEYFEIKEKKQTIGYIIYKKKKTRFEVQELMLIESDFAKYNKIIKAFSRYALLNGKITTSYTYLDNNFWKNAFSGISFKKNIEIYLTIKSKDNNIKNLEKWLLQRGDIQ